MKKVVTGIITGLALITLAGCGSSSPTKLSSNTSTSSKSASKLTLLERSQEDTEALFTSSSHKSLVDNTQKSDINAVKKEVLKLPDNKAKNDLMALLDKAFALLPKQEAKNRSYADNLSKKDEASSKAVKESKAKEASAEKASAILQSKYHASRKSSIAASKSEIKTKKVASKKSSTATTSVKSRYKKISLEAFATNPEKYEGKDIETSGHVTYVQKKPDDPDVYYVAILPKDNYSSSGYSFGSVTEVNVDTMQETPIHVGDNITVRGSGLTGGVQFRGKTLRADIVVDDVTIN